MVITVRDVAVRAGVSQATAARALGGYGYVSAATRRRVLDAAHELNYQPNDVARTLASGSSKTVGLIVADIEDAFFARVARGLANAIEERGLTLLLANSDEDLERERWAANTFVQRLVDGVVVSPSSGGDGAHLEELSRRRPLVLFDRAVRGLDVDCVTVTNEAGAAGAVRHLVELGHTRIGVVADSQEIASTAQRLRGYRRALRDAGLAADPGLVAVAGTTREQAEAATERLLALPRDQRPTALFTTSNFMTAGAVRAAHRLAVQLPGELSLVAFDDLDWTTLVSPQITVVRQPTFELGQVAGELLLARIDEPERPPQRVRLATELIVRESCGPPPRR